MSANTNVILPLTPLLSFVQLLTGNTTKDATTGTTYTLATGGSYGTRVDQIRITPSVSATPCVVRFFINNNATQSIASNNTLIQEVYIGTINASETVAKPTTIIKLDIALPSTYKLIVTTTVTQTTPLHVVVEGGHF